MINLNDLARQVLHNCDISDATNAGMYSICGLALRLRDLYKWDRGLPPWEERESSEVLEWIEAKENKWDRHTDNDYRKLSINGHKFDAFDTIGINTVLEPHDVFYGAGYARSLKPTFFLAAIEEKLTRDGTTVYILERELARDLLTIPALSQDECVILRQDSARLFLWDSIFYIKKSARPALDFALECCGIKDRQPDDLRGSLNDILAAHKETYIYHEIGELHDTKFDRAIWREIIAAFPYSPVEYLARAVKDLLADTTEYGTLWHMVEERNTAALAFYVAFLDGLLKRFFPELPAAFQDFRLTNNWDVIVEAIAAGYETATKHAGLIMELYQKGIQKNELEWAEKKIQKCLLGEYMKN